MATKTRHIILYYFCIFQKYAFPKDIHVLHVENYYGTGQWSNVTNETLYEYPVWEGVLQGPDSLNLFCNASFPIQWTFTGHYFPSSFVEFLYPQKFTNNSLYSIALGLEFYDENINWTISVRVACEKISNPQVEKSVLIFVRTRNSEPELLDDGEKTVTNSTLIPCATNDPAIIPSLFAITNKGNEEPINDTNIKYNFYEGFRTSNMFNGAYVCRSRNSSVTVKASVLYPVVGYEILPETSLIRVFSENTITFKCKSHGGKRVKLTLGNAGGNLTVNYSSTGESATVKVARPFPPTYYIFEDITRFKDKGKCVLEEGGRQVVVKEWIYEFIKTPELYISHYEGMLGCLSNIVPSSIHVFLCNNKMECSFVSKFPEEPNQCNIETEKHFSSSAIRYCFVGRDLTGQSCVKLLYPFTSGLAQCNIDGLVKEWEFFTSLENKKYTNWRNAPEKELVRMTDDTSTNGITHFLCSAVSYLFSESLFFEIEFINGSRNMLEQNNNTVNISDYDEQKLQRIEGFFFITILDITLPKDTAAIHCIATWWNETGEMRASKLFDFEDEEEEVTSYILIGAGGIVIICLLLVLILICSKRYYTAQRMLRNLTDEEVQQFFKGRPDLLATAGLASIETVDLLPFPKEYEIPLNDLKFESGQNFLGFGNFSHVVRGVIISRGITVAIKISKPSANVDFFKSLLSEVKIMVYIGKHDNVLALTGVCTENIKSRSIHIATEVCELGNLKNFLLKARSFFENIINANQEIDILLLPENSLTASQHLTTLDLIRFSNEIAKGMEYLAYKSIIHADLAARNVLLTSDKVVKVSDFGLSKKLYENTNYVKKSTTPLPWRWMAIESLTTLTFSTSSDVWAYGVTLFEIFSLGDTPYPNEEWNAGFISRLKDGMRMGRPVYSTKEIYSVIGECWEKDPEMRPSFSTLRSFFEKLSGRFSVPTPSTSSCQQENGCTVSKEMNTESPSSSVNSIYQATENKNESHESFQQAQYLELQEYGTNVDKEVGEVGSKLGIV